MSKDLREGKASTRFGKRQGPPRLATIGANVTDSEKDGIDRALEQAGFPNEAEGVRGVLFAFRDSASVRDAVAIHRQQAA